jgi:GPI ethanolamine phosphate transferase 2/3 subunit F
MASKWSKPIEPLDSDISRLIAHVHPALLLSLYGYQFKAIVADPVPALLNTLIATSVVQVSYALLCLRPTADGSATTKKAVKKGFGKVKAERQSNGILDGMVVRPADTSRSPNPR